MHTGWHIKAYKMATIIFLVDITNKYPIKCWSWPGPSVCIFVWQQTRHEKKEKYQESRKDCLIENTHYSIYRRCINILHAGIAHTWCLHHHCYHPIMLLHVLFLLGRPILFCFPSSVHHKIWSTFLDWNLFSHIEDFDGNSSCTFLHGLIWIPSTSDFNFNAILVD